MKRMSYPGLLTSLMTEVVAIPVASGRRDHPWDWQTDCLPQPDPLATTPGRFEGSPDWQPHGVWVYRSLPGATHFLISICQYFGRFVSLGVLSDQHRSREALTIDRL